MNDDSAPVPTEARTTPQLAALANLEAAARMAMLLAGERLGDPDDDVPVDPTERISDHLGNLLLEHCHTLLATIAVYRFALENSSLRSEP